MTTPRWREQYGRANRYFTKLNSLRESGTEYCAPEKMTENQLIEYGLTASDRDRYSEWLLTIPRDATSLNEGQLKPVADIYAKWMEASANMSPEIMDAAYSFFQHCYHIKDWVKNDPASGLLAGNVEQLINNSPSLSLCADICNGSKHLTLNSTRSGHKPMLKAISLSLKPMAASAGRLVFVAGITLDHGGESVDAFKVASDAMAEWKSFLGA